MVDKYLATFVSVAETLSFSETAKRLRMTQAGVSRQIKAIETSIGRQLLIRNSKSVILTAAGQQLLERGGSFLRWYQSEFLTGRQRENIRIGCYQAFAEFWLGPFLAQSAKKLQANIAIHIASGSALLAMLNRGELDFIITRECVDRADMSSFRLVDEEVVLISQSQVDIASVAAHSWVVYSTQDFMYGAFGQTTEQTFVVNSYNVLAEFVVQGLGIGCVPRFFLDRRPDLKKLHMHTLPDSLGTLYVTALHQETPGKALRVLLRDLRQASD